MVTVTDKRHTQHFGDLEAGETFLVKDYQGYDILYLKLSGGNFDAVGLENGVIVEFDYNDSVFPVEVEASIIK